MTTLTLRRIKDDDFGPDIAPAKFKTRSEARDWCRTHYPGSPITEIAQKHRGAASKGIRRTTLWRRHTKNGALRNLRAFSLTRKGPSCRSTARASRIPPPRAETLDGTRITNRRRLVGS